MRHDHSTTEEQGGQQPRTLADIRLLGDLDGWEPGHPPSIWPEGWAIDREVCANGECSVCGYRGLHYAPYRKKYPRDGGWVEWGYRAFAVCPKCGHAEEF